MKDKLGRYESNVMEMKKSVMIESENMRELHAQINRLTIDLEQKRV
jgi:hypothetical protein